MEERSAAAIGQSAGDARNAPQDDAATASARDDSR
jgi:hypothetical protein